MRTALIFVAAIAIAVDMPRAEDRRRVIEGQAFIFDLNVVTVEIRTESGVEIFRLAGIRPMTPEAICGANLRCRESIASLPYYLAETFRGTPLVHDTVCATADNRDEFGRIFAVCRERYRGFGKYHMGLDSAEILVLDGIALNDPKMPPDYSEQEVTARKDRRGLWSLWP